MMSVLTDEAARRFPVVTSIIATFKFWKRISFCVTLREKATTTTNRWTLTGPSQINVLAFVKNSRLRGEGITW